MTVIAWLVFSYVTHNPWSASESVDEKIMDSIWTHQDDAVKRQRVLGDDWSVEEVTLNSPGGLR